MGSPGRGITGATARAWMHGVGLVLILATTGTASDEVVLRVGDVRTVTLPGGEPTPLTVVAGSHETVTLLARSGHGDPRLAVLDASGTLTAQDDNGLAGWNSRLVLQAGGAESLDCEVALGSHEAGPVQLELRAGTVEAPVGAQQLEELALYHELLGEAALERGDAGGVQVAFFNAGQNWFNARAFAQARTALVRVLPEGSEVDPSVSDGSLLVCASLVFLGAAEAQLGQSAEAAVHLEAGRTRAVELSHGPLQMLALNNLADLAARAGDRPRARGYFAAAIELAESMSDESNALVLAGSLAQLEAAEGDTDVARATLVDIADRFAALDQPDDEALTRLNLAELLVWRGEYAAAEDELDRAEVIATRRETRARIAGERGILALRTGRIDAAEAPLLEALAGARELGDPRLELSCLQARAQHARMLGLHDEARRLLDEAGALALDVEDPELRASLALDAATVAWTTQAPTDEVDALLGEAREVLAAGRFPSLASRLEATASAAAYDAGRFGDALDHAREQERQALLAGDATAAAVALSNQAHSQLALGRAEDAAPLVARAVRQARDAGSWAELVCALTVQTEV